MKETAKPQMGSVPTDTSDKDSAPAARGVQNLQPSLAVSCGLGHCQFLQLHVNKGDQCAAVRQC